MADPAIAKLLARERNKWTDPTGLGIDQSETEMSTSQAQPPAKVPSLGWQDIVNAFTKNPHQQQLYRSIGAAGASAADPLNIPSAAVGLVSPQARDAWRNEQASEGPIPQIAGSLIGGGGALNQGLKFAKTMAGKFGIGAAMSAGSDFVDAGAGKKDAINAGTAGKAILGSAGALPGRVAPAVATAAGADLTMNSGKSIAKLASIPSAVADAANGSAPTDDRAAFAKQWRQENPRNVVDPAAYDKRAQSEFEMLPKETRKWMDENEIRRWKARVKKGYGPQTAADEPMDAWAGREEADWQKKLGASRQSAEGNRSQRILQEAESNRSALETPFDKTLWGRNIPSAISPLVLGAITGFAKGRMNASSTNEAVKNIESKIASAGSSSTPSSVAAADSKLAQEMVSKLPKNPQLAGYDVPAAAGAIEGIGSTGIKQLWDLNLPNENPSRRAIESALAELSPGHPDRAKLESRLNDPNAPGYSPKEMPERKVAHDRSIGDFLQEALSRGMVGVAGGSIGRFAGGYGTPSKLSIGQLQSRAARATGATPAEASEEALRRFGTRSIDSQESVDLRAIQNGSKGQIRRLDAQDSVDRASVNSWKEAETALANQPRAALPAPDPQLAIAGPAAPQSPRPQTLALPHPDQALPSREPQPGFSPKPTPAAHLEKVQNGTAQSELLTQLSGDQRALLEAADKASSALRFGKGGNAPSADQAQPRPSAKPVQLSRPAEPTQPLAPPSQTKTSNMQDAQSPVGQSMVPSKTPPRLTDEQKAARKRYEQDHADNLDSGSSKGTNRGLLQDEFEWMMSDVKANRGVNLPPYQSVAKSVADRQGVQPGPDLDELLRRARNGMKGLEDMRSVKADFNEPATRKHIMGGSNLPAILAALGITSAVRGGSQRRTD